MSKNNSANQTVNDKNYTTILWWVFGAIVGLYGLYIWGLSCPSCFGWLYNDKYQLKANEFGDAFGSFNAIVGIVTIIGLILNYQLQQEQIKELKNQVKKQEDDSKFQFLMELLDKQLNLISLININIIICDNIEKAMLDLKEPHKIYQTAKINAITSNFIEILRSPKRTPNIETLVKELNSRELNSYDGIDLFVSIPLNRLNQIIKNITPETKKNETVEDLYKLHNEIYIHDNSLQIIKDSSAYLPIVESVLEITEEINKLEPEKLKYYYSRIRHYLTRDKHDFVFCAIITAYFYEYYATDMNHYKEIVRDDIFIRYKTLFPNMDDSWLKKFAEINPEFETYINENYFSKIAKIE